MSYNILFSYAHPDDETFLSACLIHQLAEAGEPAALLLATRGDAGSKNGAFGHLTREQLGELREEEMERAARVLKLGQVTHLGFPDGKLAEVDPGSAVDAIAETVNRLQPSVVFTFPPDGCNYHPDHMAISRLTTEAVVSGRCPSVRQLYYVMSGALHEEGRRPNLVIDTAPLWAMKAEALRCHDSQILAIMRHFGPLETVLDDRRFEAFALAWEQGAMWPEKSEAEARAALRLP
ncbi:LmbE family N-acetylglucosaminyl deacetylase [Paenibacillus phyllosphaerae]|uniref:LmbE family N-acetylglucosaminyl deacetylase n=1 Tax=Paenibacillus phyllosphaerae TaxID=274593 RepID=A0A7W5AZW0_9BACL|nr:PIG-L family deacetylase [Paenibacillus phyllosphaerae]MBB3111858.1 LmbE family N-acetylglucosaminyl deacetylase [Paenibacillus phyllosphaerae]